LHSLPTQAWNLYIKFAILFGLKKEKNLYISIFYIKKLI
jgi:hypothetical protein